MSRTVISIVLAFASISLLMGCRGRGGVEQPETPPEPVTEVAFAKGADVSWASEMEKQGVVFADSQGRVGIYPVLKGTGVNSIRLRVWVDPYDEAHWSGVVDVVNMARQAFEAGLAVMIDFHYSDFFADPGRQTIPAAWSSYSGDVTKIAEFVASHTTTVLTALKMTGVTPAWVQVGNETNNGMVWPAGKIDWDKSGSARYANYVKVSNAGYDAVKEVFPNTPVIVHIANAYSAGEYDCWFFKEFKEAGGKFDIIGLSHYPMTNSEKSYTEMNKLAVESIKALSAKFSCKVMVCEVGVKPSASEGANCIKNFMNSARGLGGSVCAGVFYWEPEVDGKWKPAIYSVPGLVCNGWSAYDMGAFYSEGAIFSPISTIMSNFAN